MATKPVVKVTCAGCGKVITNPNAIKAGMGQLCAKHVAGGNSKAKLLAHRLANTVATPPKGFIKLAAVGVAIRKNQASNTPCGVNVNMLVNAIGKDRGLLPPVNPVCLPVYTPNKHRWVNAWLATTAGMVAMATGNYSKAPKMPAIAYIKA